MAYAAVRAVWLNADRPSVSFTLVDPGTEEKGRPLMLDELLLSGIGEYMDARVHFTKQGVRTDLAPDHLADGINGLIASASAHFGAPPVMLSEATRQQLDRLSRIDWSKATFGVDGGNDQEKYLAIFYYVRSQREELERQLRNDLVPLSTINVLQSTAEASRDPGRTDTVPTLCNTVFDDGNFLCALNLKLNMDSSLSDVELTDDVMANIVAQAKTAAVPDTKQPRIRKRDRWLKAELDAINQRIDQVDQRKELWALRDRMDDMEGRLDDISMQVDDLKKADPPQRATSDNPIANISALVGRNITVHFTSGSDELDAGGRALLDEVVRAMGRSATGRALITGYADASGDPSGNLALSERRAKAVRGYLLAHGIGAERLLLNYFGANHSTGNELSDRRVEIEWLR